MRIQLNLQPGRRDFGGMDFIGHGSFVRVTIIKHALPDSEPVSDMEVYELATSKLVSLSESLRHREVFEISPSGHIAILGSNQTLPGAPHTVAYVDVVDLRTEKILYTFGRSDNAIAFWASAFSNDESTLVHATALPPPSQDYAWKFVHLQDAKNIREIRFKQFSLGNGRPHVTGDGQFLYWDSGEELIVWEVSSGRKLWELSLPRGTSVVSTVFIPGRKARVLQSDGQILTLDAASGRVLHRTTTPAMYYRLESGMMGLTADGEHAIRTGPDGLVYFDCDSGEPIGIFLTKIAPYPLPGVIGGYVPTRADLSGDIIIVQLPPIGSLSPLPAGTIPPKTGGG
jgi:hypothetical protein